MDTVRFIIIILATKNFANGIQLTSSTVKATVGVDFTFTCVTNVKALLFKRPPITECTIAGGYPNGTCKFVGGYNTNYKYDCNNSTGVYKLTIPSSFDIDTLHGSNWTCAPALNSGQSETIQLYVNVPIEQVTITTSPTDRDPVIIIVDTDHKFICRTNAGRPSSRIQWYKSRTNITGSATSQPDGCNNICYDKEISSSELLYTGIKSDDGKIIYCTAVNVKGQSVRSENKSINIWYGPSNVSIAPSTQIYTVIEPTGSVGPVSCIPDDCKPACTTNWNGPNLSDYSSSVLNLQNINRNQAGNYFCTASNDAWSRTSVNISVIVNYGPILVTISPSTQNYNVAEMTGSVGPILCTANCKPACTMTWDGPNIPEGTTTVLYLQNINKNQAGKYQCNATNIIGSQISAKVDITVNYGPRQIIIAPNTLMYTVTEITGSVGPITCTADCKPTCTMTWNGPNIPVGTMSTLTINEINRNQAGNYTCTAKNSYGNKTSTTISVNVNYGPRQFNIFPSNQTYTATEGTGTVGPITCEADCKPKCTMSWNGPNLPDDISSILHLQNISKSQAGDYSCDASNTVGSLTSDTVNVIVYYAPAVVHISPPKQDYTVNETDSVTDITCTADCKPNCTMTWIGPYYHAKFPVSATSILNLHNMTRNQSGTFQCRALNIVGSQISFTINITVNFRPAVKDILGNRSFNENDTVVFSCNVESVPTANIKWFFNNKILEQTNIVFVNNTMQKNKNDQISNINISQIRCLSMGTYTCAAFNIIGVDTKDIDIDVRCSPRINSIEFNVTTLIAVKDQEPLNITAPIIAYPKPDIFWIFFNNKTSVNVSQKTSNIFHTNRIFSSLYIENVTETDFGHYRIYAINGIGSSADYIYSFQVIPKRKPNPPDNVTCIGGPNSVLVNWKSSFDGGDIQLFQIFMKKDGSANFYVYGHSYKDPGQNLYLNAAITQLTPDTTYHFRVHASNKQNFSLSELTTCNTTSAVLNDQKKTDTVAIGAGTGIGGAIVVLVIASVLFLFIRRRRVDEKIGQDKEPMQRSVDNEDDIDDGLKENPLYVSSQQEAEGAVYSFVDKKRQNVNKGKGKLTDDNSIYTQVVKTNKKDKKNKEIEMGCVYQNSKGQNDEVYGNSGIIGNFGDNQVSTPTKNKDGLIYADLDLAPTMSGNRFIIRGLENRNNYAVIDLTKTAEPLPSDSDSDDDKTTKNTAEG